VSYPLNLFLLAFFIKTKNLKIKLPIYLLNPYGYDTYYYAPVHLLGNGCCEVVFSDSELMVCKLKKSIYGLKQASRQWYYKFHQVITSYGFEINIVDDFVYHKFSESKYILSVLYVYDILLANSDTCLLHETSTKNFEMKVLGEASFVLDIKTLRDRSHAIQRLSHESYINKVLEILGMKNSKPGDTFIAKGDKFSLK